MSIDYDLIVIGAGPAGYLAAIRASQLGLRTAIVDSFLGKDGQPALGGTCLNVGCIPAKALLDSSKQFHNVTHALSTHGISVDNPRIDVTAFIGRKDKIVKQFTGGIAQLFKGNKISPLFGKGRLLNGRQVEVTSHDGAIQTLHASHVVLASGSVPIALPFAPFDGVHIIDSADAMDLDAIPKRLGVIGAGVIGLELGSVWRRLGAEVTVLEAQPNFLSTVDVDIARGAAREFAKQGLAIKLGAKVTSAIVQSGEVHLEYEDELGTQQLVVDRLLVAVGRRAYTEGLLAPDAGVVLDDRGRIEIDEHYRTSVPNVWAIGDAVRGPMLAHKGFEEGIAVAELITDRRGHVDYEVIPWVIYTEPEIAWVGRTEQQLKEEGVPYRVGSFPFTAIGRAVAMNEAVGQVKVLAHETTDRILGVHMLGPGVSELVAEAVLAMSFVGSAEDLALIVHAHPTLSEALHEAALSVGKRSIHKMN